MFWQKNLKKKKTEPDRASYVSSHNNICTPNRLEATPLRSCQHVMSWRPVQLTPLTTYSYIYTKWPDITLHSEWTGIFKNCETPTGLPLLWKLFGNSRHHQTLPSHTVFIVGKYSRNRPVHSTPWRKGGKEWTSVSLGISKQLKVIKSKSSLEGFGSQTAKTRHMCLKWGHPEICKTLEDCVYYNLFTSRDSGQLPYMWDWVVSDVLRPSLFLVTVCPV